MSRPRFILGDTPWRAFFEWGLALLCLTYLAISVWGAIHAESLFQLAPQLGSPAHSERWIHMSARNYRINSTIGAVAASISLTGLFSNGRLKVLVPIGVSVFPLSRLIFLVFG